MPKEPNVVAGEPIEADWGNSGIRDKTVQRMTNTADRDASIPTPGVGETVYVEDIDELQIWDGSVWETYSSDADLPALFVPKTGGQFTGQVSVQAGRTQSVLVRSGETGNNEDHGYIAFETNVVGNSSKIVSTRGPSSDQMGLRFDAWDGVDIPALEIDTDGTVFVDQPSLEGSQILRNIVWLAAIPEPADGKKGDVAIVDQGGDVGVYIKRLSTAWVKVGAP